MAATISPVLNAPEQNEEDRLEQLFWNRAALKKKQTELRHENDQFKDMLKQQEGASLRAKQQLEQLETMLSDPQQAAKAVAFYQLRGVWNLCRRKLSRMATELVSHQTEREQKNIFKRFESCRQASLESIDEHIAKAAEQANKISEQLQTLHERHDSFRGFWNYFKRRGLRSEMSPLRVAFSDVSDQLEQLKSTKKAKEDETGPELSNLSVTGRRKINLALIGFAQELYLHFGSRDVSSLAREASVRMVNDANYGGVGECRDLSKHIEQLVHQLESSGSLVANVRNRTRYLEQLADYNGKTDLVPIAGSFVSIPVTVPDGDDPAMGETIPINVLADEFWDIYTVLLS
jgi:hypothetical protein